MPILVAATSFELDRGAVRIGPQDDVVELFRGLQQGAGGDGGVQLLAGDRGHGAELAGRDLGVLGLDGVDHVDGGQLVVVQLGRVQPDAHGVLGAEELQFAHPLHPADDVLDVGDHVVGQGVAVHGAVFRDQTDDQQEVAGGFDHLDALALHGLGQERHGQLQLVLDLDLGDVRVGAGLEGQADGDRAGRVAGGGHVDQVVDAVQLLLDDLGDRVLHGLGRGARIDRADADLRRRDGRILGDRQGLDGQKTRQHDQDGDHPGKDRAIDEKSWHGRSPYFVVVGWEAGLAAPSAAPKGTALTWLPGRARWNPSMMTRSPGLQPFVDQPVLADGPVDLDHPRLNLVLGPDHHDHGLAGGISGHPLLRDQNPLFPDPFLDNAPDEHAGQEQMVRVGKEGPQGDRAGARIDGHVAELQDPLLGVRTAVFEAQPYLGLIRCRPS